MFEPKADKDVHDGTVTRKFMEIHVKHDEAETS